MLQRHVFNISTDTGGDFTDTGPPVFGLVMQVRFSNTPVGDTGVMDTGADFKLSFINSGVVVADYDNVGGSSWTRVPRLLSFDTGGAPVGDQYPVAAHDRLRLTVTHSAGVAGNRTGTFYVWTGW